MDRKTKHKSFKILLHKCGLRHHEADMLAPFGVDSITQLVENDLDSLIERLQKIKLGKEGDTPKKVRQLRSAVLMAAEEYLGLRIANPVAWATFNRFLLQSRICGKLLTELNEDELKALNNKIRAMLKKRNDTNTNQSIGFFSAN